MKFYFDISSASQCWAKQIVAIARKRGYVFNPNNKNYYLVDTVAKTGDGCDSMTGGYEVITESASFSVIKKKLI
jgi:hypothetical protein